MHSWDIFHEKWDLCLGISCKKLTHFGVTSLCVLTREYTTLSPPQEILCSKTQASVATPTQHGLDKFILLLTIYTRVDSML